MLSWIWAASAIVALSNTVQGGPLAQPGHSGGSGGGQVSKDGHCGGQNGYVCSGTECCSAYGWW
jgi:hypothetical protein